MNLEKQLLMILSRNWWVLLLRGLAAIAFGALTWAMPGVSLATLILLFGAYALIDGVFSVWAAMAGRKEHDHFWLLLLGGLVSMGIGIMTFLVPEITTLALLFYIAIWAISTGVLGIVVAIRLRKEIEGEWMLILSGLISVVFGVLLMARPLVGALSVLWLIAAYAIIFGTLLSIMALKARKLGRDAKGA